MRFIFLLLFIILNVFGESWKRIPLTVQPRDFFAIASQKDIVIIAGGTYWNNTDSDRIDIYNSTSDTWTSSSLAGGARRYSDAVPLQDSFMIGPGDNFGYTYSLEF